jgi:putative ABC transport system permease protein
MNFLELITLALRAIVSNKLRSILTTLGIVIGVFAIIVLVSIGSPKGNITNGVRTLALEFF